MSGASQVRRGFVKTYASNTFDALAQLDLFGVIQSHMTLAGFYVNSTDFGFDVMPAGCLVPEENDDLQRWYFKHPAGEIPDITVCALSGTLSADLSNHNAAYTLIYFNYSADITPREFTFACDGNEGWWWFVSRLYNSEVPADGFVVDHAVIGTRSRRYAADMTQGIASRCIMVDMVGKQQISPYTKNDMGGNNPPAYGTFWSPLCGSSRSGATTIERMVAPIFISYDSGVSAHVMGELESLMMATNGYTWGEAPMPGWWAFNVAQEWYAVPRPPVLAELP